MDVTTLIRTTDLVISQPLWWRCHTFPTFGNFQYIIFFSLSVKGCFTYYDQKSEEPQRDIHEHLLSNDNHLITSFYTFSLNSGMMRMGRSDGNAAFWPWHEHCAQLPTQEMPKLRPRRSVNIAVVHASGTYWVTGNKTTERTEGWKRDPWRVV